MRGIKREYYAIKKEDEPLGFLVTQIHEDSEWEEYVVPVYPEYENLFLYYDKLKEEIDKGEFSKEEVRPVVETEHGFIVENTRYKKVGGFGYYVILLYSPISSYFVSKECEQIKSILNDEVDFYFSKEQAVKSLERKEKLIPIYIYKCLSKLLHYIAHK